MANQWLTNTLRRRARDGGRGVKLEKAWGDAEESPGAGPLKAWQPRGPDLECRKGQGQPKGRRLRSVRSGVCGGARRLASSSAAGPGAPRCRWRRLDYQCATGNGRRETTTPYLTVESRSRQHLHCPLATLCPRRRGPPAPRARPAGATPLARSSAESMCRPPLATRLASYLLITSKTSISLHEGCVYLPTTPYLQTRQAQGPRRLQLRRLLVTRGTWWSNWGVYE